MVTRREWLEDMTVQIVAQGHEPSFYQLQRQLQQAGASHAEANQTILRLRGQGVIRTTFTGRFVLPPHSRRGRGGGRSGGTDLLGSVAAILGIIVALLGIWEIGARSKLIPGPGPFEIVFPSGIVVPGVGPPSGFPTFPSGKQLEAPVISVSPTCGADEFQASWSDVQGAERYTVYGNGKWLGNTQDTSYSIPIEQFLGDDELRVRVTADPPLPGSPSPRSNPVTVTRECSKP